MSMTSEVISKGFKTKVEIMLQGTRLEYYSPEPSRNIISCIEYGNPTRLQTHDGHCVIVNPNQIPAVEVYDL